MFFEYDDQHTLLNLCMLFVMMINTLMLFFLIMACEDDYPVPYAFIWCWRWWSHALCFYTYVFYGWGRAKEGNGLFWYNRPSTKAYELTYRKDRVIRVYISDHYWSWGGSNSTWFGLRSGSHSKNSLYEAMPKQFKLLWRPVPSNKNICLYLCVFILFLYALCVFYAGISLSTFSWYGLVKDDGGLATSAGENTV